MRRAKTLKLLKNIRRVGKGPNTQNAVISVTSQRVQKRAGGKLFLTRDKAVAEKTSKKIFVPTKLNYFNLLLRRGYRKTFSKKKLALAESLFSSRGQFGLLVVRPELFGQFTRIRDELKARKLNIVLSKVFLFDKTDFLEVYPQAIQYSQKYPEFTPFAANVVNGPNRVIVFRWDKQLTANEREQALESMKKHMRLSIALPFLKQQGFTTTELNSVAKNLDALGFIESTKADERSIMNILNGVHMPEATTMSKDAIVFLTKAELDRLSKL